MSAAADLPPDDYVSEAVICSLNSSVAAQLAEIEAECNRPPWSERVFAQAFSNKCALIYGARSGGRLVGFIICHTVLDEAHIVNFGVRGSARGQGIGRALITELLRKLFALGVKRVTLEVRASNAVARKLYVSLGFSEVALKTKYYTDDNESGIVMALDLTHFVSDCLHV